MKKKFNKNDFFITIMFLFIAIIILIISLYKIIKTKNFDSANTETTILLVVSLIYAFYKIFKDKKLYNLFIKESDLVLKNKKKRMKKYLLESLIFTAIMVLFDLISLLFFAEDITLFTIKGLNGNVNLIINALVMILLCIGMSFGFEYLIGEIYIKKHRARK